MTGWSPKAHGFESGGCGERSFNKVKKQTPMEFREWRIGLLFSLAKNNIPTEQLPDGTIRAKFGNFAQDMSPGLQYANYYKYLDEQVMAAHVETDYPFEEAAGLV